LGAYQKHLAVLASASGIFLPAVFWLNTAFNRLPYDLVCCCQWGILTGLLDRQEILSGLLIQFGWTAAALLLYRLVWTRGVRHYEAVGG
jgi:ABC-type uncharacterized transport system permease subunit